MRGRTLSLLVLGAALVMAGLLSHHASGRPDGLEHVASSLGFAATASPSAASGGPLAGYAVSGVDDQRLSGGLAGVVGCAVCFTVVTVVTRRRRGAA